MYLDFVNFLLAKGAKINAIKPKKEKENEETIEEGSSRSRGTISWLPLNMASTNDSKLEIVRTLVAAGADVNGRDSEGLAPLHTACVSNSLLVAEFLIQSGADVALEIDIPYGGYMKHLRPGTPLCCASECGNVEAIRLLMRHGATLGTPGRPDRQGEWAGGPVYRAALGRSFKALKCLIEDFHGDPNEGRERGWSVSPLWAAAAVVPQSNGGYAMPVHIGKDGWLTRGRHVSKEKVDDVAELVWVKGERTGFDPPVTSTMPMGSIKIFNYLLNAGADINHLTEKGLSLLHFLIKSCPSATHPPPVINNTLSAAASAGGGGGGGVEADDDSDDDDYKQLLSEKIDPFTGRAPVRKSPNFDATVLPFIKALLKHRKSLLHRSVNGGTILHVVTTSFLFSISYLLLISLFYLLSF